MQARNWLCALACAALAACEPPPPRELLDGQELQLQLETLAGVAAQARMLTDQVEAQSVNAPFAWVHQQALTDEASKAARALARPTTDDVRPSQQHALALAQQLRERINRIASMREETSALKGLDRDFDALETEAKQLKASL